MNYLKKIGLVCAAVAFFMSVSVVTGYAQYSRNRSWQNRGDSSQSRQYRNRRTENNRRWQNRSGYYNNRSYQSQYYSYGRISPREARRLQLQRARLYRTSNRYYRNDGRLSYRERRRLAERYQRYRRNVYRDRRDW
jgi:hypothetical protein